MVSYRKLDLIIGVASLVMALFLAAQGNSSLTPYLTSSMPGSAWIITGCVVGVAHVWLAAHSHLRNTLFHWSVAFLSCGFWTYMAAAGLSALDYGLLPTISLIAASLATGWELINVRYR